MSQEESGRSYPYRYYEGVQRRKTHAFIEEAIARSGGRVLTSTGPSTAPLFLGVETPAGERAAVCVYAFTANHRTIKNRPADEHRLQIRYGNVNDEAWRNADHPVAFDPLGADVTLMLGVHEEADLLIGLDPLIYDPMPIGISVEWKQADVEIAQQRNWHVWERDNISATAGSCRGPTWASRRSSRLRLTASATSSDSSATRKGYSSIRRCGSAGRQPCRHPTRRC